MSGKAGTSYSEKERLLNFTMLEKYGLNPFATFMVFEDYVKYCSPEPVRYIWKASGEDLIMDPRAASIGIVELYILTAGYVGRRIGRVEKIDRTALNLLCMSYYKYARPNPISFQLANAIEFHVRTPGEAEDGKRKNPMREIKI